MSEPGPLRRELSELLECPVCLTVPQGRIWGCTNGHTVCGACHGRMSLCPLCRDTLSHRQLKLEQLRDRMRAVVGPEIRPPPLRETSRLLNAAFIGTPPGDPSPEGGGVAVISSRRAAAVMAAASAALTPSRAPPARTARSLKPARALLQSPAWDSPHLSPAPVSPYSRVLSLITSAAAGEVESLWEPTRDLLDNLFGGGGDLLGSALDLAEGLIAPPPPPAHVPLPVVTTPRASRCRGCASAAPASAPAAPRRPPRRPAPARKAAAKPRAPTGRRQ